MTRFLSGAALLAAVAAAAFWAPPAGVLAIAAVVAVLAAYEYAGISTALGAPVPAIGLAAAVVPVLCVTAIPTTAAAGAVVPVVAAIVLGFGVAGVARGEVTRDALARTASGVFGALYVGLPLGAIVAVRWLLGREALFLLILVVVASDTAQYYTGRAFGRRPLAPSLSPKKTVEGALGGIVFGTVALFVLSTWWWPPVPAAIRLATGIALVVLGICGDLFESLLKRGAGLKDSSHLIPGHGGVLDRIDALLFVAPVYYVVVRFLVVPA